MTVESALHGVDAAIAGLSGGGLRYDGDPDAASRILMGGIARSPDVHLRRLDVPACGPQRVLVANIEGLVDQHKLDNHVIQPLRTTNALPDAWDATALAAVTVTRQASLLTSLEHLASGRALIFAPGLKFVWVADVAKFPQRSVSKPMTEVSVRGPAEAFNEVLMTQVSQIRRRVANPRLQFRQLSIGVSQHVKVGVLYIDQQTDPAIVETVITRLSGIRIQGAWNTSVVTGLIRDHPRSIFPTMRLTERVDEAVRLLVQGHVLILVEGDPYIAAAPAPLPLFYTTAMDLTSAWYDSSFARMIRFAGWAFGIYLPALYIAFTEVNLNLAPYALLVITSGSHVGLPFPPFLEVILMIFTIEILREAALRLPTVLGPTIGTVGAIVVGTAVVKAGFVSPQVIVIMTLTALSLFSTPTYELASTWRIIGWGMLVIAYLFGLLGIILGTILLITRLTDMRSFGTPYLAPFAPLRTSDLTSSLLRLPYASIRSAPTFARPANSWFRLPFRDPYAPHLLRRRRS